ncbi:MAG: FliH/SctL family protein [Pseudomonadota bacterium]
MEQNPESIFKFDSFDAGVKLSSIQNLTNDFATNLPDRNSANPQHMEWGDFSTANDINDKSEKGLEARLDKVAHEAYEKGFAQGEKDGRELGLKKTEKTLERLEGILKNLDDSGRNILKEHEKEVLQMIGLIVRKIVDASVAIDSEIVKENILKALSLALDRSELTVRVNSDDFDYVREIKPIFFEKINGLKSITIASDSSVGRGGCYVESHFGDIDATVEKQLENIMQSVWRIFEERLE